MFLSVLIKVTGTYQYVAYYFWVDSANKAGRLLFIIPDRNVS